MANWKSKFQLVGVKPGVIVTQQYGPIDFSRDDIAIEKCERLVKEGFAYLKPIVKEDKTK